MELLHTAMWHDHDIDFARWLHHAMWHVDLESWQWIHQVAAPCNVIHDSGINSPGGSTLQCGRWLCDDTPWNSPKRPPYWNSIWFRFWSYHRSRHVILHQSAKFYPNRTTLSIKMTEYRFKIIRWRISAILDFKGPIMGSFKSRCKTFYRSPIDNIALNYLSFWENSVFAFWRQTDKQTNRWTPPIH